MSYILLDPDRYVPEFSSGSYGEFAGHQMGWAQMNWRERTPAEYARVKADKQIEHETKVLREAAEIMARHQLASDL